MAISTEIDSEIDLTLNDFNKIVDNDKSFNYKKINIHLGYETSFYEIKQVYNKFWVLNKINQKKNRIILNEVSLKEISNYLYKTIIS
jgi:hypothetical protein